MPQVNLDDNMSNTDFRFLMPGLEKKQIDRRKNRHASWGCISSWIVGRCTNYLQKITGFRRIKFIEESCQPTDLLEPFLLTADLKSVLHGKVQRKKGFADYFNARHICNEIEQLLMKLLGQTTY